MDSVIVNWPICSHASILNLRHSKPNRYLKEGGCQRVYYREALLVTERLNSSEPLAILLKTILRPANISSQINIQHKKSTGRDSIRNLENT